MDFDPVGLCSWPFSEHCVVTRLVVLVIYTVPSKIRRKYGTDCYGVYDQGLLWIAFL